MKTLTQPTGRNALRNKKPTTTIISEDAERHLHWIYRNTIWQSYYHDVDDDGVPIVYIDTPFSLERASELMVGKRQPSSVTEDDIVYDKDAAYAELEELLKTAEYEEYDVPQCGKWKKITFRNAKFYWQD